MLPQPSAKDYIKTCVILNALKLWHLCNSEYLVQTCSIEMAVDDLDMEAVRLLPKDMIMRETLDMTLFIITNWNLEYRNDSSPENGVKMTIVLKRKIMNEMMTTYLPSVLLMLITYATTFFKPYFFEAALSVNLTTMLVMTTIFMTVMQMLPATAYVKMIDIFLIFGQLYPFSEVVLLTIMEYQREGDGSGQLEELEEEDDKTGSPEKAPVKPSNANKLYWLGFIGRIFGERYFITFVPEERVFPSIVIIFFVGYIAVSISFYTSEE